MLAALLFIEYVHCQNRVTKWVTLNMLISLSERFIFVANLKSGSTSIEKALRGYAEIALVESRFLKHAYFSDIQLRFRWVFDIIPRDQWFIFGVMRNPIDYMISLYNSHQDPKFKDSPELYTGEISFDDFLNDWTIQNADQVIQQYTRFLDKEGQVALNYIVSYNKIETGWNFVRERIGIRDVADLPKENESYGRHSRSEITESQRKWIEARFPDDFLMLNQYCDRILAPGTQFKRE